MYTRLLSAPSQSIFLFGPRGTGKSTWIRHNFTSAVTYDLLNTGEALRLTKEPQMLYRELAGLPSDSWAVIDEVQKVPALLDEVHRLIESHRLRFVVRVLLDREPQEAGPQQCHWDGRDLHGNRVESGCYFYQVKTGETMQTRQMLLVK